jgi:hypothetical protein
MLAPMHDETWLRNRLLDDLAMPYGGDTIELTAVVSALCAAAADVDRAVALALKVSDGDIELAEARIIYLLAGIAIDDEGEPAYEELRDVLGGLAQTAQSAAEGATESEP